MFEDIISTANLLQSWREFLPGKKEKPDVSEFALHLSQDLYDLHKSLREGTYRHAGYIAFKINDPKPRDIHKATVCDRLLHHAIHRILYPYFNQKFIFDSHSSRVGTGTHRAMSRFRTFSYKVSKNNTRQCFILKCDIRKFFANIDHVILKQILAKHISDPATLWLLGNVIDSFSATVPDKGLPLGNLTSQLLVNIYMNEFDQFAKHKLKAKYYIRYADDFVILHQDKTYLQSLLPQIQNFLNQNLKLQLHPNKVSITTISSGVDFLGWVHFPDHRVLRTATKRRMMKKLSVDNSRSYLGMLKWGNGYKLQNKLKLC